MISNLNLDQRSPEPCDIRFSTPSSSSYNQQSHSRGTRKVGGAVSKRAIKNRHNSAFTEIGLDEITDSKYMDTRNAILMESNRCVGQQDRVELQEATMANTAPVAHPNRWHQYGSSTATISRLSYLAVILAIMLPILHMSPLLQAGPFLGADAGPIVRRSDFEDTKLLPRQDTAVDVCLRWSHQSAVVNGTVYMYGGQTRRDSNQVNNTWSKSRSNCVNFILIITDNNFLTLDLKSSWQISTPTFQSQPRPSNLPAVAHGFLWNSPDTLFLYGGSFADNPAATPVPPFSMWSYNIPSSSWEEHPSPQTVDNVPVERAAEGAGVNIPSLGRGLYFGGHLDYLTTAGWNIGIARIYLKSLLEFTFPGVSNPQINNGEPAGPDGSWRNITEGGIQESAGFTERADGILVYVPGYGEQGIVLGLAGGTDDTFTQMNVIDVYDIAGETWYKQATSGPSPEVRVNPCAVAASAADGSSVQVYVYSGQKLLPFKSQEQINDMWILSIPSFTWIEVDMSTQSAPPPRSGHTCHIWNSQMVVVGGYVGTELSCDAPGAYVFDTSSLQWKNEYTALEGSNDLNQQKAQENDPFALQGSYGYAVPDAVQKVIGGDARGSATVTSPAQTVTAGPFATGKPITYTVTEADGTIATETVTPGSGGSRGGGGGGPNVAAIVAGVIAGLFAVLAGYLGFCTWVYRRQLALYKRHVAMSQRQALEGPGVVGGFGKGNDSPLEKGSMDETSASNSSNARTAVAGRTGAAGYEQIPAVFSGAQDRSSNNSTHGGLNTARSSTDDLMDGQEPTFLGVLLSPRRSLKVINRD